MSTALTAALILAHVGHWWTYVLYGVPVLVVLGAVAVTLIRERRGDGGDRGD